MTEENLEESIRSEHQKYGRYLDQIVTAFKNRCESLRIEFKTRADRALLAEDKENAARIMDEYKAALVKLGQELQENLQQNDKKFLRHVEKFLSRLEQAKTMQELENQLRQL